MVTRFERSYRHKSDQATGGHMCKGWEARGSIAGKSEEGLKEGKVFWSKERRRFKMSLENCAEKSPRTLSDVAKGLSVFF